jgi:hypothetical protein
MGGHRLPAAARTLAVGAAHGWGKSNVYFLTTRLLRDQGAGCTLLISPLLALMRNQREAAARIGVRAESVNSSNSEDWQRIYSALDKNEIDVLLISPERLANDEFLTEHLLPIAGKSDCWWWMRRIAFPIGATTFAPITAASFASFEPCRAVCRS